MQFPFCASLPWRAGPLLPQTLPSCKAVLSVQHLHLAPRGLELQEEKSIYCTKEKGKRIETETNEMKRSHTPHAAAASAWQRASSRQWNADSGALS